jgi:hypothetical protein
MALPERLGDLTMLDLKHLTVAGFAAPLILALTPATVLAQEPADTAGGEAGSVEALVVLGRGQPRQVQTIDGSALEVLVHVDPLVAPGDLRLLTLELPDDLVMESLGPDTLPANWHAVPAPAALQELGTKWLTSLPEKQDNRGSGTCLAALLRTPKGEEAGREFLLRQLP